MVANIVIQGQIEKPSPAIKHDLSIIQIIQTRFHFNIIVLRIDEHENVVRN